MPIQSVIKLGSPFAYVAVTDLKGSRNFELRFVDLDDHGVLFFITFALHADDPVDTVETVDKIPRLSPRPTHVMVSRISRRDTPVGERTFINNLVTIQEPAPMYDLVIRNGHVIDPGANLDARRDVAIRGSRIAAILDPGTKVEARRTIDATGRYVVPGLIDFHVHVFPGVSHFGIEVDPSCLCRGVTSVLDFGTAGGLIFEGFRRFVIDVAQTRVFALLHIAGHGLISSVGTLPSLGELHDLRYCSVENVEKVVATHRDVIMGIKIRCTANLAENGKNEAEGLERARQAADRVGLPLVVHSPNSSLSIEHVLSRLNTGDVLTHCFHGKGCGLTDRNLKLLPVAKQALDRGVLLDVGHGVASFDFRVARALLDQGVLPDFISSDIHSYNLHGPVFDLVTTMDKFLHLGMSLPEVIRRTTQLPAKFLKRETELGTLQPGALADITILDLQTGEFPLTDSEGRIEIGRQRLEPTHVFLSGRQSGLVARPSSQ